MSEELYAHRILPPGIEEFSQVQLGELIISFGHILYMNHPNMNKQAARFKIKFWGEKKKEAILRSKSCSTLKSDKPLVLYCEIRCDMQHFNDYLLDMGVLKFDVVDDQNKHCGHIHIDWNQILQKPLSEERLQSSQLFEEFKIQAEIFSGKVQNRLSKQIGLVEMVFRSNFFSSEEEAMEQTSKSQALFMKEKDEAEQELEEEEEEDQIEESDNEEQKMAESQQTLQKQYNPQEKTQTISREEEEAPLGVEIFKPAQSFEKTNQKFEKREEFKESEDVQKPQPLIKNEEIPLKVQQNLFLYLDEVRFFTSLHKFSPFLQVKVNDITKNVLCKEVRDNLIIIQENLNFNFNKETEVYQIQFKIMDQNQNISVCQGIQKNLAYNQFQTSLNSLQGSTSGDIINYSRSNQQKSGEIQFSINRSQQPIFSQQQQVQNIQQIQQPLPQQITPFQMYIKISNVKILKNPNEFTNIFCRYKQYGTTEEVKSEIHLNQVDPDLQHKFIQTLYIDNIQKMLKIPFLLELWNLGAQGKQLIGMNKICLQNIGKQLLNQLQYQQREHQIYIVCNEYLGFKNFKDNNESALVSVSIAIGSSNQISKYDQINNNLRQATQPVQQVQQQQIQEDSHQTIEIIKHNQTQEIKPSIQEPEKLYQDLCLTDLFIKVLLKQTRFQFTTDICMNENFQNQIKSIVSDAQVNQLTQLFDYYNRGKFKSEYLLLSQNFILNYLNNQDFVKKEFLFSIQRYFEDQIQLKTVKIEVKSILEKNFIENNYLITIGDVLQIFNKHLEINCCFLQVYVLLEKIKEIYGISDREDNHNIIQLKLQKWIDSYNNIQQNVSKLSENHSDLSDIEMINELMNKKEEKKKSPKKTDVIVQEMPAAQTVVAPVPVEQPIQKPINRTKHNFKVQIFGLSDFILPAQYNEEQFQLQYNFLDDDKVLTQPVTYQHNKLDIDFIQNQSQHNITINEGENIQNIINSYRNKGIKFLLFQDTKYDGKIEGFGEISLAQLLNKFQQQGQRNFEINLKDKNNKQILGFLSFQMSYDQNQVSEQIQDMQGSQVQETFVQKDVQIVKQIPKKGFLYYSLKNILLVNFKEQKLTINFDIFNESQYLQNIFSSNQIQHSNFEHEFQVQMNKQILQYFEDSTASISVTYKDKHNNIKQCFKHVQLLNLLIEQRVNQKQIDLRDEQGKLQATADLEIVYCEESQIVEKQEDKIYLQCEFLEENCEYQVQLLDNEYNQNKEIVIQNFQDPIFIIINQQNEEIYKTELIFKGIIKSFQAQCDILSVYLPINSQQKQLEEYRIVIKMVQLQNVGNIFIENIFQLNKEEFIHNFKENNRKDLMKNQLIYQQKIHNFQRNTCEKLQQIDINNENYQELAEFFQKNDWKFNPAGHVEMNIAKRQIHETEVLESFTKEKLSPNFSLKIANYDDLNDLFDYYTFMHYLKLVICHKPKQNSACKYSSVTSEQKLSQATERVPSLSKINNNNIKNNQDIKIPGNYEVNIHIRQINNLQNLFQLPNSFIQNQKHNFQTETVPRCNQPQFKKVLTFQTEKLEENMQIDFQVMHKQYNIQQTKAIYDYKPIGAFSINLLNYFDFNTQSDKVIEVDENIQGDTFVSLLIEVKKKQTIDIYQSPRFQSIKNEVVNTNYAPNNMNNLFETISQINTTINNINTPKKFNQEYSGQINQLQSQQSQKYQSYQVNYPIQQQTQVQQYTQQSQNKENKESGEKSEEICQAVIDEIRKFNQQENNNEDFLVTNPIERKESSLKQNFQQTFNETQAIPNPPSPQQPTFQNSPIPKRCDSRDLNRISNIMKQDFSDKKEKYKRLFDASDSD